MSSGLKSALGWSVALNAVRLLLGFLSIKVTAVFLGPGGIALVGQAGNFLTLLQGTLGNAIKTAVIKMTAEREDESSERMVPLWGTAVRLAALLGIAAGLVVIVAHGPLSVWLFGREDLWPAVVLIGLVLPLTLVGGVLGSIIAGQKKFHLVTGAEIATTIIGAAIFIGLSYRFGLLGGLVGTALAAGAGFFVVLVVLLSSRAIRLSELYPHFRREMLLPILAFYPMLLVHSAAEPLALIFKREILFAAFGIDQTGLWQATLRLSDMYTQILLTALGLYSLPTLASIKDPLQFRRKVFRMTINAAAITAIAALAIYLCRDLIVRVVFTSEFLPIRDLLDFQLLGDVFRLAGWPLRSALMVQLRVKTYMAVEAGIGLGQVALTYGLLPSLGLEAATASHAASWGITLLVLLLLHGRVRSKAKENA